MADNLLYRLRCTSQKEPSFPRTSYESEKRLLEDLRLYNQTQGTPGDLIVHVYETDATPLGIGRKHLGTIRASTVLMMGTVDLKHVQ